MMKQPSEMTPLEIEQELEQLLANSRSYGWNEDTLDRYDTMLAYAESVLVTMDWREL